MERPARVRIRRRKPWVLCRRRLFGWNVRLLKVVHSTQGGLETVGHRVVSCEVSRQLRSTGTAHPRPCGLSWTCGTGRHRFRPANGTRWRSTGSIRRPGSRRPGHRKCTTHGVSGAEPRSLTPPLRVSGPTRRELVDDNAATLWTTVDPQARKLLASILRAAPEPDRSATSGDHQVEPLKSRSRRCMTVGTRE